MNAMPRLSLSAEQRSALRVALKTNSGWTYYRQACSVEISTMSVSQLLDAALALGVAIPDVGAAPVRPVAESPVIREKTPDEMARDMRASYAEQERQKREGMDAEEQEIVRKAHEARKDAQATVVAAPVAAAPANDAASQLASIIGQIAGQSMSPEAIRAVVDAQIEARFRDMPSVKITVTARDGETREVQGHKHPQLEKLLRAASSRMANGYAPNIWISGPAGSGKTHAGHQIADALGVAFHFNGAISQEFQLLGFIDAGGTYHRTPFREVYENGGVYMHDEVDGSDNAALLALNAALANGQCPFPDMNVKRHPDSVILASANTWGLGATADYVGRAKLDAAFLSRFPVKLFWDYDTALELNISGNPKFAQRVIDARARARSAGLKVLIDPRSSQAGAALVAAGMTSDEAAEMTYLANLTPEQRRMVEGH